MGDQVTNFEINSADPPKARRFYTSVFGWKMNEVPQTGYTFVDTDAGGKGIGGGIESAPRAQGIRHVLRRGGRSERDPEESDRRRREGRVPRDEGRTDDDDRALQRPRWKRDRPDRRQIASARPAVPRARRRPPSRDRAYGSREAGAAAGRARR